MAAPPWVFTQVRASGTKGKQIILSGWNAPFGRPRKEPLIEDGIETRDSETYYDGQNGEPTRHIFGTRYDDVELHGRWRDSVNGAGGANALAESWKQWAKDGLETTIEWGDQVTLRGLLKKFVPSRESSDQLAWKMVWRVSADTTKTRTASRPNKTTPRDLASQIKDACSGPIGLANISTSIDISESFLDLIGDAVDAVQGALGNLVNIANSIDSLERAAFGQISRLLGSINQVKTALRTLMQTADAVGNDAALANVQASNVLAWSSTRSNASADFYRAQAALVELERQSDIALRGTSSSSHLVQSGDTWESIAGRVYGSPSKADVLRQSNGARYGSRPVPGTEVRVPVSN